MHKISSGLIFPISRVNSEFQKLRGKDLKNSNKKVKIPIFIFKLSVCHLRSQKLLDRNS